MREVDSTGHNYVIRPGRDSDLPFIYATWLRGQRKIGDRAFITNTTYFEGERARIKGIIESSTVRVICNPRDAEHLIGFLVYDFLEGVFVLHYIHIKGTFQRMGIATNVISSIAPDVTRKGFVVTHIDERTQWWRQKLNFKYNPYLLGMIAELKRYGGMSK